MAIFKPNAEKIQNDMYEAELQQSMNQGTLDYAAKTGEQDMVEIAQRKENDDLTRWQQDMAAELDLIRHRLKRERYNEQKEEWMPMPGDFSGKHDEKGNPIYKPMRPMMNELGINYFMTSAIPSLSRNLMMSNYDEDRIFTRLKGIVLTFIHHIAYNNKVYDIDEGDLSAIVRIFKDTIEPAHWRALNNGERNYLNTISKRIESYTSGQQPQKPKGFLAGLLG